MRISSLSLISLLLLTAGFAFVSCTKKTPDSERILVAEVKDNFLYLDELEKIISPSLERSDSAELADKYIRKWASDILMYEKAKQNTSDLSDIDRLVNEYRKTLTVHQYQQRLVEQQQKEPAESEIIELYKEYSPQMVMKENMIKGLLLVVPEDAPSIKDVRNWVKTADQEAVENIDKYSLQNAVSYDYFMDTWIPLAEVLRKTPFQVENPTQFISTNDMVETSDSTHHYFLKINSYVMMGQTEPYDLAKEKIKNILATKNNAELISEIEKRLYDEAAAKHIVKVYPLQ